MYKINNIHGCGLKIKKKTMMGSRCGCGVGGEILLGSPVSLSPSNGQGLASFPNLAKLDIPKIKKSKMKKISF